MLSIHIWIAAIDVDLELHKRVISLATSKVIALNDGIVASLCALIAVLATVYIQGPKLRMVVYMQANFVIN